MGNVLGVEKKTRVRDSEHTIADSWHDANQLMIRFT